jgi:hypothetical protein
MVGATESAPRESGSPRRAGLRCMLMSVGRACVLIVDSRDDAVTAQHVTDPSAIPQGPAGPQLLLCLLQILTPSKEPATPSAQANITTAINAHIVGNLLLILLVSFLSRD